MPELLAPGTADGPSAEFTNAVGVSSTLLLKNATGGVLTGGLGQLKIQAKTSGGQWVNIGALSAGNPIQMLPYTGTFRVTRTGASEAVGADRN